MPHGGKKYVPEGKGPVNQEKPGDDILNEFRRMLQGIEHDIYSRCDEMEQPFEKSRERLNGLQHEMQQSSLAVEAGADGERTGQR